MSGNSTVSNDTPTPNEDENTLDQVIENGDPGKEQEPEPIIEDPDEREYQEALAAAEAEEKAQADAENDKEESLEQPNDGVESAQEHTAEKPKGEGQDETQSPAIPKARFDEVLGERNQLREEIAFIKGQQSVQSHQVTQKVNEEPPKKTFDELRQEIVEKKVDLAQKYDDGEIDFKEFIKESSLLDQESSDLVQQKHKAELDEIRSTTKAEAKQEAVQASLDDHAAQLDAQHPILAEITRDSDWAILRAKAYDDLTAEGIILDPNNVASQKLFRERIANVAEKIGPILLGKDVAAQTQQTSTETTTKPKEEGSQLSEKAQQRLNKMELSKQQPPDMGNAGGQGTSNEISEDQLSKMTDDEIANLPESVRNRITGNY